MKKYILIIVLILAGALMWWSMKDNNKPGNLDGFAQCIKDSGAVFYGTFWCTHCQNQKAAFESSAKYIPYVECSTPDGQAQEPYCTFKKIEAYPTWEFANGDRIEGEMPLKDLAEKTGCTLPPETQ